MTRGSRMKFQEEMSGCAAGRMDMTRESIQSGLNTAWAGREIVFLGEVDSTNRHARMLAADGAPHGTLVIADTQSAGRGRRGRGWISPAGEGIFMSLILRPGTQAQKAARLSLLTALAVCEAIRGVTGLDAAIKWPNDIVCGGRKLCGLLLEMDAQGGELRSVVAGVGVNVHQTAFDEEIAHTASSLDLLSGKRQSRSAIVRAFLEHYECAAAMDEAAMMDAYRARSATIGRRVQVIATGETFVGTATGVTDSGTLLVEDDEGTEHEVFAADVSVRGIMGYV